jgi:hypothetical protein
MIRIDEIYNNTFLPFIKKHIPLTRMFYCDPFGHTSVENLFNHGEDMHELNYIFMHDQEPIILDKHQDLFNAVITRNRDLNCGRGPSGTAIVVSEKESEFVDLACKKYGWTPYYYFFHGWAALDWYRGYDKTFLIDDPNNRKIIRSVISPNRIIGGERKHRVLLMYHLLKKDINNAFISFPQICPVEKISITDIAENFVSQYPDIIDTFASAGLPWEFSGETGHPMHSCWLSLFEQSQQSLCYLVTETVYYGQRHHLTEKTFKPICLQMPFVMVSAAGSLEYLRSYGFKTWGDIWDESYDLETNDEIRIQKIADLVGEFDNLSPSSLQSLYQQCLPAIRHNYAHFYGGGFEKILWKEFQSLLENLKNHR